MAEVRRVGVCGAGAMGSGIAQVAATAGYDVIVFDLAEPALEKGRGAITATLSKLSKSGRLEAAEAERIGSRVRWTSVLDDLAGCDLVIEAILEDMDAKRTLFARLEATVGPGAILATNTSSLPIASLAGSLARPDRFVGMHFFNPPTAMKLIEVIAGPATSPEVTRAIVDLGVAWKKKPVVAADVPGFIVNRVARPFYAEAFLAMQEEVAPPEAIDHLFRSSAGFRMGPLELTDLIGQDVNYAVARSVYEAYDGRTRFRPQAAQEALVAAGRLGRKAGRGVYDYRDAGVPAWAPEPAGRGAADVEVGLRTATPAARPIWRGGVMVRYTRGLTARAEADEVGRPVAVLDWFDGNPHGSVGYAASDATAASVAREIIAVSRCSPILLKDRPGLVVTRTLAQIANAAGDAIVEGVSDEAGVDQALKSGANYPFGPCQWARLIGVAALRETLNAIALSEDDDLYNPSPFWSREFLNV